MSRSRIELKAFAPAADSAPPANVQKTSIGSGMPRAARNIAGTVVTSSSSMMRGFVNATYAPTVARTDAGALAALNWVLSPPVP